MINIIKTIENYKNKTFIERKNQHAVYHMQGKRS